LIVNKWQSYNETSSTCLNTVAFMAIHRAFPCNNKLTEAQRQNAQLLIAFNICKLTFSFFHTATSVKQRGPSFWAGFFCCKDPAVSERFLKDLWVDGSERSELGWASGVWLFATFFSWDGVLCRGLFWMYCLFVAVWRYQRGRVERSIFTGSNSDTLRSL
jgi:hypothetical protein